MADDKDQNQDDSEQSEEGARGNDTDQFDKDSQDDSDKESDDESKDKDADQDDSASDADKSDDESKGNEDESDKSDKSDDTEDVKPIPKRRSAKDFIIKRQSDKIEKLKSDDDSGQSKDGDGESSFSKPESDDIDKRVQKAVDPLVQNAKTQADEQELADVFRDKPEFKPFEKQIRESMEVHPTMPVLGIAYAVAGDRLKKIGADEARKSDKKADDSSTTGTGSGKPKTDKDYSKDKMSSEDFEKEVHNVKTGKR